MRRMRTLPWGVLLALSALLGCTEDSDAGLQRSVDGSGGRDEDHSGGTGGTSAGTGGTSAPADAGEGGAGSDPPGLDAAARRSLCETICATEAALPCAVATTECVLGWCSDGIAFPPAC